MKKILTISLFIFGLYYFYPQSKSVQSIADGIHFENDIISYNNEHYITQWTSNNEKIEGQVRFIETQYYKHIPVITTKLMIADGDYNDPNLVKIEKRGNGYYLYNLKPQQKISGSMMLYYIIPANPNIQNQLSQIQQGDTVSLLAKFSTSGKMKSDKGTMIFSSYKANEFVPVKLIREGTSTIQLLSYVEAVL